MRFKELLTVLDTNAYLNILSEKGHRLYEGKAIFITTDLLERTVKEIDIIRNEFFIVTED
jgi:hypothetical protein